MKINIEQLERAVHTYFNTEILTKATGFKKFTAGLVFEMYSAKLKTILIELLNNPLIKLSGIIDENNFIDVEQLYHAAKEAIHKSGQFTQLGIIFNESDIDKLYTIIQQQTQIGG